jgi:hypothetical protein
MIFYLHGVKIIIVPRSLSNFLHWPRPDSCSWGQSDWVGKEEKEKAKLGVKPQGQARPRGQYREGQAGPGA